MNFFCDSLVTCSHKPNRISIRNDQIFFISNPIFNMKRKRKRKAFPLKKKIRWIGILKNHWSQEKTWRGKRQASDLAKQESSRDWLLHHRHCGLCEHWDSDTKWVQLGGIWRFLFRASGLRPLDEDVASRVWRRRKTTRIETKIRRPKPIFSRWQFSQVTTYCGWLHPETERPKVKPSLPLFLFFCYCEKAKRRGNYRTWFFMCSKSRK